MPFEVIDGPKGPAPLPPLASEHEFDSEHRLRSRDGRDSAAGLPEWSPAASAHRARRLAGLHLPWPETGHRTYLCRTCGAIAHDPQHNDDRQLGGLERGR